MASRNAQLAEAIKTALNAGSFSQTFTAVRSWVVSNTMASSQTLQVNVVPAEDTSNRTARDTDEHTMITFVGIEKKVLGDPASAAANTEIDALVQFTEEISDFFGVNTVSQSLGFFINSSIQVLADPARLLNDKLYLGIVRVEYLKGVADV